MTREWHAEIDADPQTRIVVSGQLDPSPLAIYMLATVIHEATAEGVRVREEMRRTRQLMLWRFGTALFCTAISGGCFGYLIFTAIQWGFH